MCVSEDIDRLRHALITYIYIYDQFELKKYSSLMHAGIVRLRICMDGRTMKPLEKGLMSSSLLKNTMHL